MVVQEGEACGSGRGRSLWKCLYPCAILLPRPKAWRARWLLEYVRGKCNVWPAASQWRVGGAMWHVLHLSRSHHRVPSARPGDPSELLHSWVVRQRWRWVNSEGGGCRRGRAPLPLQLGGMKERCKLTGWGLVRTPSRFASSTLLSYGNFIRFLCAFSCRNQSKQPRNAMLYSHPNCACARAFMFKTPGL